MSHSDRTFAWACSASALAALGAFGGAALFGGCEAQPCTNTSLNSDDPSPAIECPSGDLCYRGQCIRACSAGQENVDVCTSDDDCDATRPRCVGGFCSICEAGEQCVPILNICQSIDDVDLPDPPLKPTPGVRPPSPLDGGPLDGSAYLDGGLSRIIDAGVQVVLPEVEVTHSAFVDLALEEDYRGGAPAVADTRASVVAYDVRGNGLGLRWRTDLSPPAIQCEDDDDDRDGCGDRDVFVSGACELRPLRAVTSSAAGTPPRPVDIGDILIADHVDFPASIRQQLDATFNGNGYTLAPPQSSLPTDLLVLSAGTFEQHYISVTSAGDGSLAMAWPMPPAGVFLGHHVPFELEPATQTLANLVDGPTVANPPTADLYFQWNRIDTGNDSFERVIVRVLGTQTELFCDALEGANGQDTIQVTAGLLREWQAREPPGVYPLYFERASAQRLDINEAMGYLIDVTVRVRHTLIGEIEVQ